MGLRIFLRDRNDFAAKTELEMVIEYFCRIEVGLRKFLSKENREEELDLESFVQKTKGRKGVGLEYFFQEKSLFLEKESKEKQVRREVRSPVR